MIRKFFVPASSKAVPFGVATYFLASSLVSTALLFKPLLSTATFSAAVFSTDTFSIATFSIATFSTAVFSTAMCSTFLFATPAFATPTASTTSLETRRVLRQARQARLKFHPEQALKLLNQLLTTEPKNADVFYDRTDVYMDLNRFDLAKNDIDTCIRLKPRDAVYYRRRAKIQDMSGHPKEAIVDYEFAIKLDPKDPGGYRNRAIACKRTKNYPAAGKAYDDALEMCGTCTERAQLMLDRGDMYFLANDLPAAQKSYDALLQRYPDMSAGHYGLAKIFARQGKTKLAAKENDIARNMDLNMEPLLGK